MSVWKRFTRKAKKVAMHHAQPLLHENNQFTLKNRESLQTIIYMNKTKSAVISWSSPPYPSCCGPA